LPIPAFTPAAPTNIRDAFDHDDFLFELKMDGFRAIAHCGSGGNAPRLAPRQRVQAFH